MTSLVAGPLRSRAFPIAAAAAAVVLVSIAAYNGKTPTALSSHGVDKILHASMCAVLTSCLSYALRGRAKLAALLVMRKRQAG